MHKFISKIALISGVFALAFNAKAQLERPQNQWSNDFQLSHHEKVFTAFDTSLSGLTQQLQHLFLNDERLSLTFLERKVSPLAQHFHFQLHYKDRAVYQAKVRASVYKNNRVYVSLPVFTKAEVTFQNQNLSPKTAPPLQAPLGEEQDLWFPTQEGLVSAQKQDFLAGPGVVVTLIKHGQTVMQVEDERRFKQDTLLNISIFNPDPLTTANQFYGGNFIDNNDANNTALAAQQQMAVVKGSLQNGVFSLENNVAELVDDYAPSVAPVTQTNPDFIFDRSQYGFEDVSTLYHLTEYGEYIQALGYNLPGFKVNADAHGYVVDQSSYSGRFQELRFGDGGVDDAEDADVIVHEFFHAVVDGASNSSGGSLEKRTLEEALCDFVAHSYSKDASPHQVDRIFNWDGHNEFWPGRSAVSQKNYTQISFNGIYEHTDLMVSCLRELESDIGRSATNSLILESIYSLTPSETYQQFAYKMLRNDSLLYNGDHVHNIHRAFKRRQVLPMEIGLGEKTNPAQIQVYNSLGFSRGEALTITAAQDLQSLELLSIGGKRVLFKKVHNQNKSSITGQGLRSGLYLLKITTANGAVKVVKLSKA